MSDSLRPHEPQHARPPCPSQTPGVYSDSCPLSQWCHPAISSSVVPFSSCPQSLLASGSFQISQLFSSGGQSIGVSASASVLPMDTQDWSPGWISLQSKGLSRVFSNTTVQKHLLGPCYFCPLSIVSMFAWNVSLISPVFLKRSLVFPTLLLCSISLHCSFKKAFLSLLALLWNSAISWVYLSLLPLLFVFLLSSAMLKVSSDNHFAFLHVFFFGMILVTESCTIL